MLIDGEKVYLFNPWKIKRWSEDEIATQVNHLIELYNPEDDTMYGVSLNIEVVADILYLYGEMIARLTDKSAKLKLENDSREQKEIVRTRKNWIVDHPGDKAPAMSYFEAEASEIVREKRNEQIDAQSDLTRFKLAYESMEQKINALKKKQESIRYEEFNK